VSLEPCPSPQISDTEVGRVRAPSRHTAHRSTPHPQVTSHKPHATRHITVVLQDAGEVGLGAFMHVSPSESSTVLWKTCGMLCSLSLARSLALVRAHARVPRWRHRSLRESLARRAARSLLFSPALSLSLLSLSHSYDGMNMAQGRDGARRHAAAYSTSSSSALSYLS